MMTVGEFQDKLLAYLTEDFEHGPLSDMPFLRAEAEPDGMLSLYTTGHPGAFPSASLDVPQLAEFISRELMSQSTSQS